VIDIWAQVTEQVAGEMMGEIGTEAVKKDGKEKRQPSFNPIFIMADSGPEAPRSRSGSWPECAA